MVVLPIGGCEPPNLQTICPDQVRRPSSAASPCWSSSLCQVLSHGPGH